MGNFLSVFVCRPCSFLPEVTYLILSPLSYSHPLSVLYETISNHSPPSGIYSVQQDAMGGVHNPKHLTGPGQWSTRLSSLEVQGCPRDSAEGTVGTKQRCLIHLPLPHWRSGITIPAFIGWGSWRLHLGKVCHERKFAYQWTKSCMWSPQALTYCHSKWEAQKEGKEEIQFHDWVCHLWSRPTFGKSLNFFEVSSFVK